MSMIPRWTASVVPLSAPRMVALQSLVLVWIVVATASADIGLLPDEVESTDVIAIERDRRDLFAFDGLSGARSTIRLEIGENVLFEKVRGRIGLVLTDRRALAVTIGTGWRELRFQLKEKPPWVGLVEERIALIVTDRRALAFTAQGAWAEAAFTPNEVASALRAGASAGVVTTNRRALGIGSDLGRFVSENLRVREEIESVTARDTIVTLRTDRRILVFSAPRANWSVQRRRIN